MARNERLRRQRVLRNRRQQDVADQIGVSIVTFQRWERGIQQPSAYYRVKLCELFGLSAQDLGLLEEDVSASEPESAETTPAEAEPVQKLALWTVPYARNPHFTGRDTIFEHLQQQFAPAHLEAETSIRQVALTQAQAIKGLGGIGKTQTAVEYAYRAREQELYTHTLWITSASEEALLSSFAAIADQVPALSTATGEMDQRKRAIACLRWLEACEGPWLLIFDNADDLTFLPAYLPRYGKGNILLTTRINAVGALATSIELDAMGVIEGTHLLLRRAQLLDEVSTDEMDEATNLTIVLGQFPLALDQAGAYIEETGCSVKEYLHLFQHHRHALLAQRGWQITNYPDSVTTTWELAFQRVKQTNPAAAELLQLCAFLAPDHIPEELLSQGAAYWPPALQQAVSNSFAFCEMLKLLLAFSLIKRFPEERQLSIHRLVQAVQVDRLSMQERSQWAERLVRALQAAFPADPTDPVKAWPQCQRYLEQAQACDLLIQEYQLQLPEATELLDRTATYLRERALYTIAEPLYQKALSLCEQQNRPQEMSRAHILNHLAILSYKQGQHARAESFFLRALHIQEQYLGSEHPEAASILTDLATLYEKQGKHEQAEPLYLHALHIQEQYLGSEHPNLASTLAGLAFLYFEQGRYTQSEELYLRALHIQEQHLSAEHLDVASILTKLAYVYAQQGRYAEVEALYLRALHIEEQHLGPEHPTMSGTLTGLANHYRNFGRYAEAEQLYQQALALEQHLGPDHPELARPLLGLALLSFQQGKHDQAEQLHRRVLHIQKQLFGVEHHSMACSLIGLADISQEQGQLIHAEELYQQALRIREQQLGSEHPHIAIALHRLANLYTRQGDYERAEPFYQRALSIHERQLGMEIFEIAELYHDVARFRQRQGQREEAHAFYQRALHIREHVFGADHPFTNVARELLQALRAMLEETQEAAQPGDERATR